MTLNGKIDSVYDFTDKGLRELESWLEVWMKGTAKGGAVSLGGSLETEDVGTSVPGPESGIFFDTVTGAQVGMWLDLNVVGDGPPELRGSSHYGFRFDDQGGGGYWFNTNSNEEMSMSFLTEGGMIFYGARDFAVDMTATGAGNINLSAEYVRLLGDHLIAILPTTDPGIGEALWNDGGTVVFSGSTAGGGGGGTASGLTIPFSIFGALSPITGALPWDVLDAGTITKVQASVGIAPSGGTVVVTVKKNGTAITTITIAAGTLKTTSTVSLVVAAGDRLTVDVTSTTAPAANLVVLLKVG